MDSYLLAPGLRICFDEIHTNSWTKGDSSQFSGQMLILNFCIQGRCDVSLAQNRYAIVKEGQLCASTIWPTKDFYYPGRLYEGIQIYVGLNRAEEETDFLPALGICPAGLAEKFRGNDGVYLHRMSDSVHTVVKKIWEKKEALEPGELRYLTLRLLHEIKDMPKESELDTCFTRSQIAIVKEAESLILADLSRRITAKEMAERFGISKSSFKWYVRGILGDSYLSYFRKKRMEKAAELLENTGLKVIEIANQVGYENQGKFAGVFAETYGVTPLEFRRCRKRDV